MSDFGLSRRRDAFRRLLFFSASALCAASTALAGPAQSISDSQGRIERRELRVTRDRTGDYRIVEAFQLRILDDVLLTRPLSDPLPIATLEPGTRALVHISAQEHGPKISYETPHLTISGNLPGSAVPVVISYRLPPEQAQLQLLAPWPTDTLIVEVARGSVAARLDGAFDRLGEVGSPSQPRVRYFARDVEAGRSIMIRFPPTGVDWRSRVVVFVAVALAAGGALYWVWKRDPELSNQ